MTISAGYYGSVNQQLPPFVIGGAVDGNYLNAVNALVNADPQALQTYTITVGSASTGTVYTMTVNGEAVSYTAISGDTTTTIAAELARLANLDPLVGFFTYTSASAVVTATAISIGTDFVITGSNVTVVETVAPAGAAEVPFGRGVLNLQTFGPSNVPYGSLVYAAKLSAQVDTLTVAYTSGKAYEVVIAVAGQTPKITYVVAATDLATLTTALVDGINGQMPANTVLAASSVAGTITLTAEIPGLAFVTSIGAQTTASNLTIALTTSGPLTDINRCFAGVALANYSQPGVTVGLPQSAYVANMGMGAMIKGRIAVESTQTVAAGDKVYIETAAGDDAGKFFNTPSSTRLQLLNATWNPKPSFTGIDANILVLN